MPYNKTFLLAVILILVLSLIPIAYFETVGLPSTNGASGGGAGVGTSQCATGQYVYNVTTTSGGVVTLCSAVAWAQITSFPTGSGCASGFGFAYKINATNYYCSAVSFASLTNLPIGCTTGQFTTNLTSSALQCSSVTWADLTGFPSPCPSGQFVSAVGTTLTCGSPTPTYCSPFTTLFYVSATVMSSYTCGNLIATGTNASVVIDSTITACIKPCDIFIGNGTFLIGNEPIAPVNNVNLQGSGRDITTFELASGVSRHLMIDNTGNLFNFTVSNIGFNGNKYAQTEPSSRVNGELVLIAGRGNQHIYFNNVLCQYARSGACLDLTAYDLQLIGSTVQNNGVTGATFPSDGVHSGGSNITEHAIISQNFIQNNTDTGLALDIVDGSSITGNNFNNNVLADQTVDEASTGDTFSGNVYNETLYDGMWVSSQQLSGSASFNITYSGNAFVSSNHTTASNINMFFVKQSNYWTVTGNTFTSSVRNVNDFIDDFVLDSYLTFSGNTVSSFFATSAVVGLVFLNGITNSTITGNTFSGGSTGIQFATNLASTTIIAFNSFIGVHTNIAYVNHQPSTVRIQYNPGYNPIGVVNFVNTTGNFLAPFGSSTTLVASTTYTVIVTDIYLTCTGGTGTVTFTIKDQKGTTIDSGLTTLTHYEIVEGWQLVTSAFSGAPTCVGTFN